MTTPLIQACQGWTTAETESQREAIRSEVRRILERQARTSTERALRSAFDSAIAAASAETDEVEAKQRFSRIEIPTPRAEARPIAEWLGEPEPAPVVWRDPGPDADPLAPADTIVSVGEPGVISGPGGLGKSTITRQLALVASVAHESESKEPYGSAVGLRIRAGPVLLVGYEEGMARVAAKLVQVRNAPRSEPLTKGIEALPDPEPLFLGTGEHGKGGVEASAQWELLWETAERLRPSLIVIDPAAEALVNVAASEPGPVRTFLRALARESETIGCGVLIVAHDTKAARASARLGEDPGPGAIAGSGAWYDRARGALYLTKQEEDEDIRILRCIKANNGRYGWQITLDPHIGEHGRFHGFRARDVVTSEDGKKPKKRRREAEERPRERGRNRPPPGA